MELGDDVEGIKLNTTLFVVETQEPERLIGFDRQNSIIKVVKEMPKIINNIK
jgi:hypothetical protein